VKQPILLVGETGTSKTAIISNFLRNIDSANYVSRVFSKHF
jgi:MoxR-like ATPase